MANEIVSVSIPQMDDDIDIIMDIEAVLRVRGFHVIDPEINRATNEIVYRFQKVNDGES